MKNIYLDNAATTYLRPEVILEMTKSLQADFGNPSSTHSFGRHSKSIVALSRKKIATLIGATSAEIIFTSGATEANNWILKSAVCDLNLRRIITSKIEHQAVLQTIIALKKSEDIEVDFVQTDPNGQVDLTHLVTLLSQNKPTLVSLMLVNNEIGNLLNIEKIVKICNQYKAFFHTDAVQAIGKIPIDLTRLPIDFLVASAHKFHGPKGAGFVYIKKGLPIKPLFFGGEQEKSLRPGTESIHNIVGMTKALQMAVEELDDISNHILALKNYTLKNLKKHFINLKLNGDFEAASPYILNVMLPIATDKAAMLLFHLDLKGIAVSRGSACQSGSLKGSHVLNEILSPEDLKPPSIRISFCYNNTFEEIDTLIAALIAINT